MAAWECRTVPETFDYSETVTRVFDWEYDGERFGWEIELPYSYYRLHRRRHRFYTYGSYVADKYTQRVVDGLCSALERKATQRGYSRFELAKFATAFVQHLPYTPDEISTSYSNYPRYPVETLVDETGDCEDGSLLLASILHELGFDVVLIELPTHLAVGVHLPDATGNFRFDGQQYAYVETTATGWEPGVLPPRYQDEHMDGHSVSDAHALFCGWRAKSSDDAVAVAGTVMNVGTGPATDVSFRLYFNDRDGDVAGYTSKRWPTIEAGGERQWRDTIWIENESHLVPDWALTVENVVHDEDRSTGRDERSPRSNRNYDHSCG